MQLISLDFLEIQLICLSLLFEDHFFGLEICSHRNNVTFSEFERLKLRKFYFNGIIGLAFCIRPTSSVSRDEISSMSQIAEIKRVVFTLYKISVTHTDGYPI
jgi:hypothetical protein